MNVSILEETMRLITSTPDMQAACIGRKTASALLDELRALQRQDKPFPGLTTDQCWILARYGYDPLAWRVAMIQLMARARAEGNARLWKDIGAYLSEEAKESDLQEGVLWRFWISDACPQASRTAWRRFRSYQSTPEGLRRAA